MGDSNTSYFSFMDLIQSSSLGHNYEKNKILNLKCFLFIMGSLFIGPGGKRKLENNA